MLKRFTILPAVVVFILVAMLPAGPAQAATRYMESLNRGVVAVNVPGSGIYVGWRMFGTDPTTIGFNIYRNGAKITSLPITTSTNYMDSGGSTSATYYVRPVIGGVEQAASETANVWASYISGSTTPLRFKDVPIQRPADVVRPNGTIRYYSANDCSVGDLDGDGEYEIVVKWDPNDSQDNSIAGYTGNVYLDAYKLNGTRLWRIDLGINIRAGAHYTQFMVYDLDGDGKAEVACKTAPGTKDGPGNYVLMGSDSPTADYRNSSGYILSGPEYLTIFSGPTGANLATTAYDPPRGTVSSWGDSYGNRVDRFLACIAYVDGVRPSLVMCRGYYTRAVLVAWNWRGGALTEVWKFDSDDGTPGNTAYRGQGNHNLSVGDVDGDGFDEIIYGSCCIDHDGKGKYSTGLGHGDAMHFGDLDPSRPGYEVFGIHEGGSRPGQAMYAAVDGTVLWQTPNVDVGRGCAADIDPAHPGAECWASDPNLHTATGAFISANKPSSTNFLIWWDGDLSREVFDTDKLDKWNPATQSSDRIVTVYNYGTSTNNSTKKNPCLQADVFGDWREEFIERTVDSSALRIFTPVTVTSYRIHTLMHDPVYRLGIAWQNAAYNQPPHTGFFLGNGMTLPVPLPDITLVSIVPDTTPPTPDPMTWQTAPYATGPTAISMTATTGSDDSGVEYYFANLTITDTSHDSGWQDSPTYTDTGLTGNTTYTYIMAARDKSPAQNQGGPSPEASATTLVADTTSPTPNPMTWQLYPYALGTSSITMTASTASDASGVEYYFDCVSGGGHDSGWQSAATYTDTGLTGGTTYIYTVKARDISPAANETASSVQMSVTTPSVPPLTPPSAYWPFDETSGSTAYDIIGSNNGTLQGTPLPSWTAGQYGNCATFVNTTQSVRMPHTAAIDFASESFSVSLWAKQPTSYSGQYELFIKGTIGGTTGTFPGSGKRYELYRKDSNFRFAIDDNTTKTEITVASSTVCTGNWVHIVAVRDITADQLRLYANGSLISSLIDGTGSISQTEPLYVGYAMSPGAVDDLRIYRYALTQAQITSIYGGAGLSDVMPPTPNPMTFATAPYGASATSVAMVATTATDASGVEYMFACTAGGGHSSAWQDSTSYTDSGLSPSTTYNYTVQARDKSSAHNANTASSPALAMTLADATPPTPATMTFATAPYGASSTSVAMVATTASDISGVEYIFTCTVGGGHSSAWQDSTSYTDSGLIPSTTYTYTVQARDKSSAHNANTVSSPASATTQADTTPPTPSPMSFATAPYAASETSISMVGTTATDITGVEYMFTCTVGGGHSSAWQDSTSYTDTGLTPSTTYTYTVKARDKSVNHTETLPSEAASAITMADTTAPMPNPMTWAVEPNATAIDTITMTATTATDISGVEYFFANITDPNHNSAWQDSSTYTDIGLNNNMTYTYAVIARDKSIGHNETGWSGQVSATTLRYVCTSVIASDLDHNCQVDLMDFALMGNTWAGDAAAWTGLTQFTADWLVCNRNPAGECWQ